MSALAVGVVLYRNSRPELERLLASLALCRQEPDTPAFDVMWLDNSEDGSGQAVLTELDADARCGSTGENLGFGRAHNRLIAEAFADPACRAYVCVNPDAVLHPRCLAELAKEASQGRVGLVDARLFPDEHPKPYDPKTHATPWCCGTVLLVTRALFEAVGGFDERFFMYSEDVDLCARLGKEGHRLRYLPEAVTMHAWGASTAQRPAAMLREAYVSRLRYFDKHFPGGGGALVAALARVELRVRLAAFSLLGILPGGASWRRRAAETAACRVEIRRLREEHV